MAEAARLTERAFWEVTVDGLGRAEAADDLLHPHLSAGEPGASLTETQYLGFNVPEADIHAIGYLWYHPNLGTVTGGIGVWQGVKPHPLCSEIWDYVTYMNDDSLAGDLHHYALENGYQAWVLEPLTAHRIQYSNPSTDSSVDVIFEALAPPVMLSTGLHFEQPMRTSGEVRLRGTTYEVSGTTVRDRSFGQLRREKLVPLPPLAWMNGAFSESLSFGCTAFDDPARKPEWTGTFSLPGDDPLRGGWIVKDGALAQIVEASKVTVRRRGSFLVDRVELTVVDQLGRTSEITGRSSAGVTWQTWHNMDSDINLMRWELDGEVAYGDYQEFLWPEYVRQFHP